MNSLKLLIFSIWALLREAVSVLQQRAISDQWYLMPRFWLKLFQMLTRLQRPPWPSRPRLWLPPWCFASSKLIIFYPHKNCFFLVFSISFLLVGFFFVFLSLPYFWNFFVGLFVEWGKQLEQEQQVTSNSLSFSISLFLWIFSFFLFFFFRFVWRIFLILCSNVLRRSSSRRQRWQREMLVVVFFAGNDCGFRRVSLPPSPAIYCRFEQLQRK